jgi:tetratricopeptide (TPR) repeat protein
MPRVTTSRLRVADRVDSGAVWIWALCTGLVLYLGLNGGGYDLVVRSHVGVIVWWVVLLGAVCGVLPASRLSRAGWGALALFSAFVLWTAIASTWSLSSERSLQELSRVACYLGVLGLAITTFADRRRALRHTVAAIATAVFVIAALALVSRLRPGTFAGSETTAALLPDAHQRLSWPLNYWNALGALVALGLPLLISIATSARTLAAQACAAAAIPIVALCGYLTFSRGGAIAGAVAVIVFLALAPDRVPKLVTALISAAGSAALIAGAVHRQAIEQGSVSALARREGATLLLAILLVCAGVGLAQIGIGLATRHGTRPKLLQISQRRASALSAAALVIALAIALGLGAPSRLAHAWRAFKQPTAAALRQDSIARFGALSGNERYTYWKTGIDALPGHVLGGYGPGTFQLVWLPRAPVSTYVIDAHSLYVETLVEVGLVGLVVLAGFLLTLLAAPVRAVAKVGVTSRTHAAAVAAAVAAFLISAAFDWVWQMPVLPIAILLLGAAALAPAKPSPSTGRRAAMRAVLAVGSVASLVAIGVPLASTDAVRASQAQASTGNLGSALADARSAIRLEPGAESPQLQAALVLELEGRFGVGATAAKRATADEPDNWQPWLVLSRLETEAGQPNAALADYRRARSLNPRSPLF